MQESTLHDTATSSDVLPSRSPSTSPETGKPVPSKLSLAASNVTPSPPHVEHHSIARPDEQIEIPVAGHVAPADVFGIETLEYRDLTVQSIVAEYKTMPTACSGRFCHFHCCNRPAAQTGFPPRLWACFVGWPFQAVARMVSTARKGRPAVNFNRATRLGAQRAPEKAVCTA